MGWMGPIEVWTIEGEGEFEGDYAKLSALLRLTHHSVRTLSDLVKAGGDKMSTLVSVHRPNTIQSLHETCATLIALTSGSISRGGIFISIYFWIPSGEESIVER